jgi:DUF4097 and DUF4098 domain-containing protein YvlB
MSFKVLKVIALALALCCVVSAQQRTTRGANDAKSGATVQVSSQSSQQSVAAARDATVTLCVEAGDVTVRGWDREEVRATVAAGARVVLRRAEAEASRSAASRVEVLAFGANDDAMGEGNCSRGGGAITLDVPRGGFVQLKSYTGRIAVEGVAGARVETLNGDVGLRDLSQWAEATSGNGAISVRTSKGRAHLRTISGRIEASDVASAAAGDDFSARTTTGDISLSRIGHTQVEASTTNGDIDLAGALARGGLYTLHSQAGNVTVTLPEDASFALVARVYTGEIVTEFPIRQAPRRGAGEGRGLINAGRLAGIAGKSDAPDATLSIISFNGSINLRKSAPHR